MVAFGILPQNSGRLWGPTNDTFAYDCSFSGADNQRWWGHSNPTYCNLKNSTSYTCRWWGCKNFEHKHLCHCSHPCLGTNTHALIFKGGGNTTLNQKSGSGNSIRWLGYKSFCPHAWEEVLVSSCVSIRFKVVQSGSRTLNCEEDSVN